MLRQATFSKDVYSLDVLKKAVYKFSHQFSSDIELQSNQYICNMNFPDELNESDAERIVDQLKKEVLDQDLRESIKKETEATRNLILAHAFSKTNLISDE